jgi:hypothetical protein
MKKLIFVFLTIGALITVILSCKKNLSYEASKNNQLPQINQNDLTLEQRILSFESTIRSTLKTGYSYPIDTAIRYIEGLVNFNYGDVQNNLIGISIDSVFINAHLTDGKITPEEASNVYDAIVDSLTIQYQNLPTQNLHLIFADVFRKDSISGTAIFGIISAFGYGSPLSVDHFGNNDYWMYGFREVNSGGYCDGLYYGENKNEDAASKIRDKVRIGMGVLVGRHYTVDVIFCHIFTDLVLFPSNPPVVFDYDFLNTNDEIPGDNMYDWLILEKWSDIVPFDTCLIPDEMNFYMNGAEHILYDEIYTATEGTLGNKELIWIDIRGEHNSYYFHPHAIWHVIDAFYGIRIYNPDYPKIFD